MDIECEPSTAAGYDPRSSPGEERHVASARRANPDEFCW